MAQRSPVPSSSWLLHTIVLSVLCHLAAAHGGHHDAIPEGEIVSPDPIDSILWTHILLMITAFGVIFPTGMVLGIVHSRWHVPVQIVGTIVAVVAWFLGHMHRGRQFVEGNIHASYAWWVMGMLMCQVAIGTYLKCHFEERRGKFLGWSAGMHARMRPSFRFVHGWLGKLMPIVAWVQFVFGATTAVGFCRGEHLGQCLAHFIMGGAFVGYGIVMTIILLVGQVWLRRTGRSQEFFDSLLIAAWGCVNTFTEHRWGGPWVQNDLQHTTMGIVWWCAGLLGVWLSRSRNGKPRRNIIPAIVIILTGWGMSAHPQELPLSTMVHTVFGYTLIAAGATRIIEISFVLKDSRGSGSGEPSSFQHLPPFLLYASGFLFMGATEEQMHLLSDLEVTHVSYILILFSISFLLYLFINILLNLYATHTWADDESNGRRAEALARDSAGGGGGSMGRGGIPHSRAPSLAWQPHHNKRLHSSAMSSSPILHNNNSNGEASMNGGIKHPRRNVGGAAAATAGGMENQHVRDAEEFELEGLIDDDDDNNQLSDHDDKPANGRLSNKESV